MITLKFLDGDFTPTIHECKDIHDALDFDYKIWASLGENCNFYYNDTKLDLDTIQRTRNKIIEEATKQINEIKTGIVR